jgi:hypothetical protein
VPVAGAPNRDTKHLRIGRQPAQNGMGVDRTEVVPEPALNDRLRSLGRPDGDIAPVPLPIGAPE